MSIRRFKFIAGLLLLIAVVRAAAPEAFPGLNRKWKYYQSPNFELYSARSDAVSRDVLERMELLRALFIDTFKLPVRMPQPVTIFAFDSIKDFNGYRAPERQGDVDYRGFCYSQADRTTITLAPTRDRDNGAQLVYHEYIHCLFHMAEKRPPPWFNEGAAELFSTLKQEGDWMIFGTPIPGRIYELRTSKLMPFEQLFSIDYDSPLFRNSDHTGLFYSESWALLHYLKFGVNRIPPDKVAIFLRAGESGWSADQPDRFRALTRELLGGDYPQLERDLDRYVSSGTFIGRKVRRPEIAAKATYAVRPATPGEMNARLAELSLRFTRSGYAEQAVRNLLEREPEARLREVLGSMALQANEPDRAREHWLSAFELGTTNVAIFRELGRLESNLIFSQFNLDYRIPEERAARLRSLLNRSLEQAPEQSNGYEMLAWVEATAHKPDIAALNRIQARFGTLNNKPRTLLALAVVRMRLGQEQAALEVLNEMDKLNPDDWVVFGTEITRARLEKRPVDRNRLPKASGRQGPTLTPPKLQLPH